MSERETLLRGAVRRLMLEYDAWVNQEEAYLTDRLARAIDDALLLWAYGDLPGDCRELAKRIDGLAVEWKKHEALAASHGSNAAPSRDFWRAFRAVQEAVAVPVRPAFKPLEPIQRLVDEKVSRDQICRIYGFVDAADNVDYQMLEEEILAPGKHTGPETGWLPPLERRLRRAAEERMQAQTRIQRRLGSLAAAATGDAAGSDRGTEAAGDTDVAAMDRDPSAYEALEETIVPEEEDQPVRRRKGK